MAMRDLQACQAEVFRRSEARIKARKQRRKHILLACIPLALCLALLLPGTMPASKDAAAPENNAGMPEDMPLEMVQDGTVCPIAEVRVDGQSITDPDLLLQIHNQIELLSANKHSSNSEGSPREPQDNGIGQVTSGTTPENCVFITVTHYAEQTEYCLSGYTLENRTEGWSCTLTPEQAEALTALLTNT